MSWSSKICGVVFLSVLFSSATAAPPPPPVPPPADMPTEIDGYNTSVIWYSYGYWIKNRIGAARALVLEQRPSIVDARYYFSQSGPRARAFSNETGGEMFGRDIQIDQWCSYAPGEPLECVWLARSVSNLNNGEDRSFLRANFDIARAITFLRQHNIPPEAVDGFHGQSFGLPDPLSSGVRQYVDVREVTETDCEGVTTALETARHEMSGLNILHEQPAGDPPPPPPPHAGIVELTLPGWFVQRGNDRQLGGATVQLYGSGPSNLAGTLTQEIFAPVEACLRNH